MDLVCLGAPNTFYGFTPLSVLDVEEIFAIEQQVYTHPWTRGNFLDTFSCEHQSYGLRGEKGQLCAYFLMLPVVDEYHLLTFAVALEYQGKGLAKAMLEKMREIAIDQKFNSILLEVRVSNQRAIAVYARFGFQEIGRRKGYYPAENGTREDAIVMRLNFINEETV